MSRFSRLGNDLYTGEKSIDFVGRRHLWYAISAILILVSIGALAFKGLDMGIEFVGGSEFRITVPTSEVTQETADEVREAVAGTGIKNAEAPVVTTSGTETILVQVQDLSSAESGKVVDAIAETTGVSATDNISQTDIGPSWGQEVAKRSAIGLAVFLVLVVLFIWAYFREWKMSMAAITALIHDIVITVGIYALSGFEVTPATVTGFLTILGFSLYDTVVVFDKVRENTKDLRRSHMTYEEGANLAVNQTLVRSINTSVVALIPVGAILYVGVVQLGSGSLKDLALALFVGMAVGAYSSIFIATPMLAHMKSRESAIKESDRRARTRRKHDADRYAAVPTYSEGMPIADPDAESAGTPAAGAGTPVARDPMPVRPSPSGQGLSGPGRVPPPTRSEVRPSPSAGRSQPSRQPRAKRGKK